MRYRIAEYCGSRLLLDMELWFLIWISLLRSDAALLRQLLRFWQFSELDARSLPTCVSANQNHDDPKTNRHCLRLFLVGGRLRRISYEPLRRHGFQDVERLGKQYAALKSSQLWAPCPKNSMRLPNGVVPSALFPLSRAMAQLFAALDIENVTR